MANCSGAGFPSTMCSFSKLMILFSDSVLDDFIIYLYLFLPAQSHHYSSQKYSSSDSCDFLYQDNTINYACNYSSWCYSIQLGFNAFRKLFHFLYLALKLVNENSLFQNPSQKGRSSIRNGFYLAPTVNAMYSMLACTMLTMLSRCWELSCRLESKQTMLLPTYRN